MMALDADTLLDRMHLKQQIMRWRTLALFFAVLAVLFLVARYSGVDTVQTDRIARVTVNGVITDDIKRTKLLNDLAENSSVKALFVHMDTPGGTAYGGEQLYRTLKRVSEKKPVVILMRTVCTSAGYMAALGGNSIFARESTITGSIGVIMQSFEATELAETIGIKPVIIKSAENKAVPNPLEVMDDTQRALVQNIVNDFKRFFVDLVATERSLNESQKSLISDGRIFTGTQAIKSNLIDSFGGEEEALAWLKEHHEISEETPIKDAKPDDGLPVWLSQLEQNIKNSLFSTNNPLLTLDGLLLIWQPALR
ncbi:MAG: signal peptide peptidase SppA [Rickettsiales bacterium]|nr:signal peptide peptidase SppA [Rickettsiales bacterium]